MARQVSEALQVPLVQPMVLLAAPAFPVSALLVRPDPRAVRAALVLVYKAPLAALLDLRVRPVPQAHPQVKLVPQVRLAVPLVTLDLRA